MNNDYLILRKCPFCGGKAKLMGGKVYTIPEYGENDLLNTLQEIAGWDLSKESYRVDGALIVEENAMLFDLKTAKILK